MTEPICIRNAEDLLSRINVVTQDLQRVSPAESQLVELKSQLSLQQEQLEGIEASIQFEVLDDKSLTNDDKRKAALKKRLHETESWLKATASVRETQRQIRAAETQHEVTKRASQTVAAILKAADLTSNMLHLYARKTELEAAQTRLKGMHGHASR